MSPDAWARLAGYRRAAGVDEAGRGPWAGPVVAAAVILARRLPGTVRIGDSKRLTPLQRERAFHAIAERGLVGIGIVSSPDIDRINILQATFQAMRLAVADLPQAPDAILVDGDRAPQFPAPAFPFIGGDRRSTLIGCASIMAKVLRDRLMTFYDGLAPDYGFHAHKGYGTAAHAERLRAHGPCVFHRHSFRPILEICGPATSSASQPD